MPDAFFAFDPMWRCVYLNDRAAQLAGGARETLLGQTLSRLFPEIVGTDLQKSIFRAVDSHSPVREEVYDAPSNSWYEYAVHPSANGMVLLVSDVSNRKSESRLSVLAAFGELIRRADEPGELLFRVSELVGEFLQVRRCLFNEIDLERDMEIVHRDYCRGVPSVAGQHRVSEYSPITSRAMREGKTIVNFDSSLDPRTAALYESVYAPQGERSYVTVPLLRDGHWVASLWVSDDRPRRWTENEITLLETVAERTWITVEKLRVDAALRESEERLRVATEAAQMFSWETDLQRGVVTWSDNAARIIGCDARDLPSRRGDDLFFVDPVQHARAREAFEEALRAGSDQYAFEFHSGEDDAQRRYWNAQARIMRDASGTPLRVVGVTQDVTARKRAELERERLLANEQELRTRAEESSRLKDEFLAIVSHELRTPMTSILGWASLLKTAQLEEATCRTAYDAIDSGIRTQTRIVDDLLDVGRIIGGKLRIEPQIISVFSPIREAIGTVAAAAEAKSIEIVVKGDAEARVVSADHARLQQVFWNLLSNAVRFTPVGGRVSVDVSADEDVVSVAVSDTGEGIAPEFIGRIFERFSQADGSSTRRHGGLGLGLSIVRYIVELHGGSVAAFSAGRGKGATFTVKLPRVRAVSAHENPPRVASPLLRGVHILVVDDDIAQTTFLKTALETFGASVTPANDVSSAIDAYRAKPPDIVLSDIAMPDADGYALASQLRAICDTQRMVAITAYGRGEERERARLAGFREVITKPVEALEIARVLSRVAAES